MEVQQQEGEDVEAKALNENYNACNISVFTRYISSLSHPPGLTDELLFSYVRKSRSIVFVTGKKSLKEKEEISTKLS